MSLRTHRRIDSTSRASQLFARPDSPASGVFSNDSTDADSGSISNVDGRSRAFMRPRGESSLLAGSLSSSLNQKFPARSYYQRSYHASHRKSLPGILIDNIYRQVAASIDTPQQAPEEVREDTAELATRALSDVGNSAANQPQTIQEVSEPNSPPEGSSRSVSPHRSLQASALSEMIRSMPQQSEEAVHDEEDASTDTDDQLGPVTVGDAIISQPHEGTPLIGKQTNEHHNAPSQGHLWDLEGLLLVPRKKLSGISHRISRTFHHAVDLTHKAASPSIWNRRSLWRNLILTPVGYVPAVLLGLLLNILDALSYGMILFPLGQPLFAELGPDGISMFYISCIVSQLVYSLGGSIFKGGIGSEMIEVVPFFHKMAFTIMARVGEDNPRSVLATTILAYSTSSVLTGLVFFVMGQCGLGMLIGFFPRHILIGCIGGKLPCFFSELGTS